MTYAAKAQQQHHHQQQKEEEVDEVWLEIVLQRELAIDELTEDSKASRELDGSLSCPHVPKPYDGVVNHGIMDSQPSSSLNAVNWTDVLRNTAGPDGFFAMLVGPDIIPFTAQRRRSVVKQDAGAAGIVLNEDTRSTLMQYVLTSSRPLWRGPRIVDGQQHRSNETYVAAGDTPATTTCTYVLQLQQHHYNYGAVHDRDVFGAPHRPMWVVGKTDGFGRAGAIKLQRQKLKVSRLLHQNKKKRSGVDDGEGAHHNSTVMDEFFSAVDVAITSDSVLEITLPILPSPPPSSAQSLPRRRACSLKTELQRLQQHGANNVAARGRYVAVSAIGTGTSNQHKERMRVASKIERTSEFLDVRGWTYDKEHPIRGKQYIWEADSCDVMPLVDVVVDTDGDDDDDGVAAKASGKSQQQRIPSTNAASSLQNSGAASSERDTTTTTTKRSRRNSSPSVLASCFANHGHKVLFLGDSQLRTLFHTTVSLLTLRKAMQGKLSYGRLLITPPPLLAATGNESTRTTFSPSLLCRNSNNNNTKTALERAPNTNPNQWRLCTTDHDVTAGQLRPLCPPSKVQTVDECLSTSSPEHSSSSVLDSCGLCVPLQRSKRWMSASAPLHLNTLLHRCYRCSKRMGPFSARCPPPQRQQTASRQPQAAVLHHNTASAAVTSVQVLVEMIWDPLLLNLSYFSRASHRRRQRRWKNRQDSMQRCAGKSDRLHLHVDADDKRNDDQAMPPLHQALAQEEEEESNTRLRALEEEYNLYGPDAALLSSNATFAAGGPSSGASTLHRALLGPNSVDTIVLGFGGWFGLHLWRYSDIEPHLADIVDALSHVAQIRRSLRKKRLVVLVAGTPAWPSYVTWDGHRRNTNYRLGIITQLIRAALPSSSSSSSPPHARLPFDVVHLPYFEMSYPMSHLRFHVKDIHYDRSMVPYAMVEVIGTLLCQ
ncbi:Hypothetical protein, putative [Bodo saltans]|uniref:Uncharacterized protein n=1 Tax=Bodo saltans TaxID=75058 RepID=A0A0S4KHL7_BODSA|nr:Hypothetical protein, putative [Bodo saltans]|eukprot:CUI14608.1 Hypothetical protein, putative [Bodo saltans]